MQRYDKMHSRDYIPLYALIPNIITMMSLFVGCQQFMCTIQQKWGFVVFYCIISSLLDVMDGRVARSLDSATRFGAELDSLADMVVFGVAPAFTIYNFSLYRVPNKISWSIAILYIICLAIRLARFNTHDIQGSASSFSKYGVSMGLPAPMCAASAYLPIMLFKMTNCAFFSNFYFCASVMIITSYMSVSTIATPTFKKFYIKAEHKIFYIFLAVLLLIATYAFFWYSLLFMMGVYYISIVVCQAKFKRLGEHNNGSCIVIENPKEVNHDKPNTN